MNSRKTKWLKDQIAVNLKQMQCPNGRRRGINDRTLIVNAADPAKALGENRSRFELRHRCASETGGRDSKLSWSYHSASLREHRETAPQSTQTHLAVGVAGPVRPRIPKELNPAASRNNRAWGIVIIASALKRALAERTTSGIGDMSSVPPPRPCIKKMPGPCASRSTAPRGRHPCRLNFILPTRISAAQLLPTERIGGPRPRET